MKFNNISKNANYYFSTFLITRGPPSAFLSIDNHPFDIALLKPILAPGHEF